MLKVASVSQVLEKYSENPIPVISFTFDDAYYSTLEKGYPILNRHNFPGTVYVPINLVGSPGYLTVENLQFLSQQGWEIGSHSVSHRKLPKLPEKEIEKELLGSKRCLENWGFKVTAFASPGGAGSKLLWNLARKYYQSSRGIRSQLNKRPFYSLALAATCLGRDNKIEKVRNGIDRCIREKAWWIINIHQIDTPLKSSDKTWQKSRIPISPALGITSKFLSIVCDYVASKQL